ncbi:DNA-binding response regulator [Cohnella suwonensis]|uniref:DNA-binding response regulator n=1 Tax=Cohnella suwonensis TaxID=696072 RepID=A0ABW0LRJ0_9BACL
MVMHAGGFEADYGKWLEQQLFRCEGERARRLKGGLGHAEKEMLIQVWWPAFGKLRHLQPEYEVTDFLEGKRFIDLAYIRPPIKIAFEIDGFGPHLQRISRDQFSNQWVRQMHLLNNDWIVVRISYDDVRQRPRLWQQLIQQMMWRLFGESAEGAFETVSAAEKEIVRLAIRLGRPLKLPDVQLTVPCGYRMARATMDKLVRRQWFQSEGGGVRRMHSWRLILDERQIHKIL